LLLPLTTFAAGPFVLTPLTGVVVLASAVGGPVGLLFATLGAGVGHAVTGTTPGTGLLVELVGYVVLGGIFNVLWASRDETETGGADDWRHAMAALMAASLAAGSVSALGFVIANEVPFFPASMTIAVESFVSSAVILGGALVGSELVTSGLLRFSIQEWRFGRSRLPHRTTAGVGAILFVWVVVGTGISVVYQSAELVPPVEFSARGLGMFGDIRQSGWTDRLRVAMQTALGATVATVVVRMYYRETVTTDGANHE
jgi:hypothetical protein